MCLDTKCIIVRVGISGIVDIFTRCCNVVEKGIHIRHDQVIAGGKLSQFNRCTVNEWGTEPTLMQSAKHLAAADNGGGDLLSEENPYSKSGRGDVTKRRR